MAELIYSEYCKDIDDAIEDCDSTENLRECMACGKLFMPEGRNAWRQKYCNRNHFVKCGACGKEIPISKSWIQTRMVGREVSTGCSRECSNLLKRRSSEITMLSKYGVDNASKVPGSREKARNTMLASNKYQEIGKKNSDIWKSKSSEEIAKIVEKREITSMSRYGVKNPAMSNQVSTKISAIAKSNDFQTKYKRTSMKNYGVSHPARSVAYINSKASKYRTLNDEPIDSTWEKIFYDFLLATKHDKDSIRRNIPMNYTDMSDGSFHTTFIDFEVDGVLFEVKSPRFLKGEVEDSHYLEKLEVYRNNKVILITDSTVSSIFDDPIKTGTTKSGTLIGVDISLFKAPVFPVSPDRPLCFYKTLVNSSKSSYDAFHDDKIRWNMILNRIKYAGGFIDNKAVLRALNVTKKYKQPSWFSKTYAKSLIKKYCKSETIVDPFAGWGTRYDAAKELGRNYIGIDLNSDLVSWHLSTGRDISMGDAKTFTYDSPCSVFSCPPYSDTEIYFDGQDTSLSGCDWVDIVIKNIPNASEYVFVVDSVDSRYAEYVVSAKENQSHFGTSSEYVLCIPGFISSSNFNQNIADMSMLYVHDHSGDVNLLDTKSANTLVTYAGWEYGLPDSCNLDKIWVCNGYSNLCVSRDIVNTYVDNGWCLGMVSNTDTSTITINNGSVEKRVLDTELDMYLNNGWFIGSIRRLNSPTAKKKRIYDTTSDRFIYVPEDDVQIYLSLSRYELRSSLLGRVHVYNPVTLEELIVSASDVDTYLSDGWLRGRAKKTKNVYWVHNDNLMINKRVSMERKEELLANGWKSGQKRFNNKANTV